MTDVYLITGGMGCIGAWVLRHLVKQGKRVVNFDLSEDRHRIDDLLNPEEQTAIHFIQGDLTLSDTVQKVFDEYGITHVIHLAALQVPFCRANPVLGAQVNVTGTINIFEAALKKGVDHLAFASSMAVYGAPSDYPLPIVDDQSPRLPRTLYGVYKVANEDSAKVYYNDHGITSTALRPYTVYGVGRDQGLTSEPTSAMLAAAKGEDFHMTFGGRMQFHYASDVALQFIEAAENPLDGAHVFNLGTQPVRVQEVADLIMKLRPNVTITLDDKPLPFPEGADPKPLHDAFARVYETSLEEGIRQTIEYFELLATS